MESPLPGCSKYSKIEICSKLQKISLLSLYNSTALAFALKSVSNLPERTPYNSSPAPVYRRSLPWLSIFMINELAELSSKVSWLLQSLFDALFCDILKVVVVTTFQKLSIFLPPSQTVSVFQNVWAHETKGF